MKAKQLQHALEVTGEPVGAASNLATFVWQALEAIKDKDCMQRQLQQCLQSKEQCPQFGRLSSSCVIDPKDSADAVHPQANSMSEFNEHTKEEKHHT